jgi:hypothetical protein
MQRSEISGQRSVKIPLKNGDEYDALTRWKRVHNWRAGDRAKIKRAYRRRLRRCLRRTDPCSPISDLCEVTA